MTPRALAKAGIAPEPGQGPGECLDFNRWVPSEEVADARWQNERERKWREKQAEEREGALQLLSHVAFGGEETAELYGRGLRHRDPRTRQSTALILAEKDPSTLPKLRPELILAAEQDKTFGAETPTDGYSLLNLSASYTLVGAKVMHIFTLKGTNLTDELYRNHSSFIKDVAPEMGRRLLLTYALRLF